MKPTKLLLLLAITLLTFTSCKNTENEAKCWLLHVQYRQQSESIYFWGTEIEAETALNALETSFKIGLPAVAKITGTKGVTENYSTEGACKDGNDEFREENKEEEDNNVCWQIEFIYEDDTAMMTYFWTTEDKIDNEVDILRKATELLGKKVKKVNKSISEYATRENCLGANI